MNAIATRSATHDFGLLLIRLVLAAVFLYHGSQKLFGGIPGLFEGDGMEAFTGNLISMGVPYPRLSAWLAALAEFGAGVFLILGMGMRIAIIPAIFTMVVAIAKVHPHAFGSKNGGMEYPLTLGVVLLGLVFTGPGRFSVGNVFKPKVKS
jgi:putative oxidoreductase